MASKTPALYQTYPPDVRLSGYLDLRNMTLEVHQEISYIVESAQLSTQLVILR
jgi:hypothetical protein